MPLTDNEVKSLVTDLLKTKSKRDKQSRIGASEIGNPCEYCVAHRLAGTPRRESKFWMGARIGTGIHAELEKEIEKHVDKAQDNKFKLLEDAASEYNLHITDMEGYGEIRSTADLMVTQALHLIDFKTTKKLQLQKYKLHGVPEQYVIQQQLYAYGFNQIAPGLVERISLVFINRDGSSDDDVWVASFDYDEKVATAALDRLRRIWEYVQDGQDLERLDSYYDCFYCNVVLQRIY